MDKKDMRILFEISENAKESRNKLAKKLRVSREVLDYRIKKMQGSGIIRGYQARINLSNFIYGGYILLVRTLGTNKERELGLFDKIKKNGKTQYIGKMGGNYDLIIGFTAQNLKDLKSYMHFINKIFGKMKSSSTFLTMIKEVKDSSRGIFSEKEIRNNIISMPILVDKKKTDRIDKIILETLSKDCLIPSWEIAEKSGISDVAIRKRIKSLVKKELILGFRTMIDLPSLGFQVQNLFIKFNPKNPALEKNFHNCIKTESKITYCVKTIGEYDYVITLLTKNNLKLNEYISKLRNNFRDSIQSIEASSLFETPYHTQLAKDILS